MYGGIAGGGLGSLSGYYGQQPQIQPQFNPQFSQQGMSNAYGQMMGQMQGQANPQMYSQMGSQSAMYNPMQSQAGFMPNYGSLASAGGLGAARSMGAAGGVPGPMMGVPYGGQFDPVLAQQLSERFKNPAVQESLKYSSSNLGPGNQPMTQQQMQGPMMGSPYGGFGGGYNGGSAQAGGYPFQQPGFQMEEGDDFIDRRTPEERARSRQQFQQMLQSDDPMRALFGGFMQKRGSI